MWGWTPASAPPGRRLRGLGAALLVVAWLLVLPQVAAAHAQLIRTDPPDGIVLDHAPRTLELWFSAAVVLDESLFRLVDDEARSIPVGSARYLDDAHTRILLALPDLSVSTFRLAWQTLSVDGHSSSGTMVFGVASLAGTSTSAPTVSAGPEARDLLPAWLGFLALAALTGAVAVGMLLPGNGAGGGLPGATSASRIRLRLLLLASGGAALGLVTAAATALGPGGGEPRDLAALAIWLAMLIGAVTGVAHSARIASVVAWGWRGQPPIAAGALACVIALATIRVLGGHAGAQAPWATASAIVHTLAAAGWAGGLLALALVVAPLLRRDPGSRLVATGILRRFGVLAAGSLAAVLVTGLLVGGELVATVDALLFSAYGQVLIVKVALAAAVALVGLANAAMLHPWIRIPLLPGRFLRSRRPTAGGTERAVRRRLPLLVGIEALGALVVVLLGSVLATTPPAQGLPWASTVSPGVAPEPVSGTADDLLVSMVIRPNRPGRNFVSVAVFDTRRPAPGQIEGVVGRFAAPAAAGAVASDLQRSLTPLGDGQYETTIDLPPGAASWRIGVDVQRDGLATASFGSPWTVPPAPAPGAPRAAIVSNQPLAPLLDAAAVGIAVTMGGLLVAAGLRRWWRAASDATAGRAALPPS